MLLSLALLGAGCEQDLEDRPPGTFSGSFRPPPGGGGVAVDDAGPGDDAGVVTRVVEGRVVAIEDLGDAPDRAPPAPDRQVAGFDPSGVLVTALSALDGSFTLGGLARTDPLIVSASGDPPSFVVIDLGRSDPVIVPVIDVATIDEIAASVTTSPGDVTGHVLLWLEDGRGEPVRGLTVEVVSASPFEGPFYGTSDPTQLTASPPTGTEGLVVLLNAVAADVELSVFRAEAPDVTELVTLPVEAGVVTFAEVTTGL